MYRNTHHAYANRLDPGQPSNLVAGLRSNLFATQSIITNKKGRSPLIWVWTVFKNIINVDSLHSTIWLKWLTLWLDLTLTLSPLAVNFEDRWWPLQTMWIQMKPHKMWGFIWDPNCLTFRLYISKKMGGNNDFFWKFWKNKYLKKLPSMQRLNFWRRMSWRSKPLTWGLWCCCC